MDILKRVFIAIVISGALTFLFSVPVHMTVGSSARMTALECYRSTFPGNEWREIDFKAVNSMATIIKARNEVSITIFLVLLFLCLFQLCLLIQFAPKQSRYKPKAEFNGPNDQRGTEDKTE